MNEQAEMFNRELLTHRTGAKAWPTPPSEAKAPVRRIAEVCGVAVMTVGRILLEVRSNNVTPDHKANQSAESTPPTRRIRVWRKKDRAQTAAAIALGRPQAVEAEWSDRRIAEVCGVSNVFASKVHAEIEVLAVNTCQNQQQTKQHTRTGKDGKQYPTPSYHAGECGACAARGCTGAALAAFMPMDERAPNEEKALTVAGTGDIGSFPAETAGRCVDGDFQPPDRGF